MSSIWWGGRLEVLTSRVREGLREEKGTVLAFIRYQGWLHGPVTAATQGFTAVQQGPVLGLWYYGHHSKILINFIIDFVICKWSQLWPWRRPGDLPAASAPFLSRFLAVISLTPWALTGLPDPLVIAGAPPTSAGAWAQVQGGSLRQGV